MALLPCISLCTGGGGLERGIARAIRPEQLRPLLYVEREAFATAYLVAEMEAARLAPAPIWSDLGSIPDEVLAELRELAARHPVLLCGGIPCQPWSAAGKRAGADDERWIWPAVDRIIREVVPAIVALEEVPGITAAGGLSAIVGTLAACGYAAEWDSFSAAEAGAPHRRERLFLVAWRVPDAYRRELRSQQGRRQSGWAGAGEPGYVGEGLGDTNERGAHSLGRRDRQQEGQGPRDAGSWGRSQEVADALADPNGKGPQGGRRLPGTPEGDHPRRADGGLADQSGDGWRQGRAAPGGPEGRLDAAECGEPVADGDGSRRSEGQRPHGAQGRQSDAGGRLPEFPPGPDDWRGWLAVLDAGRADLLPRSLAEPELALPILAPGVADASRVDLLRLGGNGVVPAQAELAFRELWGRLMRHEAMGYDAAEEAAR